MRVFNIGLSILGLALASFSQLSWGVSWEGVVDPELDLATQLTATEAEFGAMPVAPAPRLVVGQGEDPSNQTVIRVFNQYGICERQWLAFPSSVTGGVGVATLELDGENTILAWPLADTSNREVRLFSQSGELLRSYTIPAELAAPFTVVTGRWYYFKPDEQFAVASRYPGETGREIYIYDRDQNRITPVEAPRAWLGSADTLHLQTLKITGPDQLLIQYTNTDEAWQVEPIRRLYETLDMTSLPSGVALYPSALAGQQWLATGEEPLLSTLHLLDGEGTSPTQNIGKRENRFWIHPIAGGGIDEPFPAYSFSNQTDGWWAHTTSALIGSDEDSLIQIVRDGSPFDPYIYAPTENYDGDLYREFAMEVTVSGAPAGTFNCSLLFFPQAGGVGSVPFTLQNGMQTVRLNLEDDRNGTSAAHTGTITRFRLDLPDGASYASFADLEIRIDWLAVSDDPAYVPVEAPNPFTDYVHPGYFRHIRTDAASPAYDNPLTIDSTDPEDWIGSDFPEFIASTQANYEIGPDSIWEPTASHRQFVGRFDNWKAVNDSETGLPLYSALSRLDAVTGYTEVGSDFEVMSWAPGNDAVDRLVVWPLREYLRALAPRFRALPEKMVALEPNHEFEIEIALDSSIGDYNPAMIRAFREHLQRRYTTLAKINARMGTSFATINDIDPPRNTGRGSWDDYNTGNAFLLAWVDFSRRVVNFRIMQGMRESLLAGFPPEVIKCHQIPANYAVGDAAVNGRVTPIDWVLANNTGYGGTRYGIWYDRAQNWIQGAAASGYTMTVVGEYHPLTTNQSAAAAQLRYMFENGVNFIHHMTWNNTAFNDTGRAAYMEMITDNVPRPGTTGGAGAIKPVIRESGDWAGECYNIVQIGSGSERNGLLKSIDAKGEWEGTVYLTPFHAQVQIDAVAEDQAWTLGATQFVGGPVAGLYSGDQIEIRFEARTDDANGKFTSLVLHDGIELGGHRQVQDVSNEWIPYHYTLRFQNPMDEILILINSGERDTPTGNAQNIELRDFSMLVHRERVTRHEYYIETGAAHRGGVSFDVLSPEARPEAYATTSPFPEFVKSNADGRLWQQY